MPDVVVLASYHVGESWTDGELAGLLPALGRAYPDLLPAVEYLDAKRFPAPDHLALVRDYLLRKYAGRHPDLVVALDNPALDLLRRYPTDLFPSVPVVFAGINDYRPELLEVRPRMTGVAEVVDIAGNLDLIQRLRPRTAGILVIHDHTATGLAVRHEMESLLARSPSRIPVEYAPDLPMSALTARLARLPSDWVVLVLVYATDTAGQVFSRAESTRLFSAASPVPVFAMHEVRLGAGIVGGDLLDGRQHGEQAAALALRVLGGADPRSIPVEHSRSLPEFDDVQLRRFAIPGARLPGGSRVVGRPESFYRMHRALILGSAGGLSALSLLVLILTRALLRVRRAESALRVSEQHLSRLAALYRALSDANQAMVRLTEESPLCEQVCTIVSRLGGYRLVWIGHYDAEQGCLVALAVAGAERATRVTAQAGPPADAARAGPGPESGLLAEACLRSGAVRSCRDDGGGAAVCFPLFRHGELDGVLEIRSADAGDFDPAVTGLLEELAADISYALDNLDRARRLRETLDRLSRSEAQYRLIVEASNEGIWLIDTDHRTRFVNPRMAQMLGYSVEEMMGTRSDDYLHPDERGSYGRQLEQRHQLVAGCYESRLLQRDGTSVWVQISAVPLQDEQGGFSGSFGMVSDITARKQAELELERYRLGLEETIAARTAELQAAESHLRLVLESTPSGLFGIDTEGRISVVNPAACRMLGYEADELLGAPCHPAFHARHADGSPHPASDCPIQATLTQGRETKVDDDVFWRADGRPLPVIYSAHPMFSEGRIVGVVVGFLDISERKRTEARLQEARDEAERLSQVKSVFLANMSHEIRTPMNAILGMTHLLQRDIRDPVQRDRLDKMTGAANHLLAVINDILDFSKIEAGKLVLERVEFDLSGMLERACALVDDQVRAKGLTLVTRVDGVLAAVPRAIGDVTRLIQVLVNFFGNAVKFTERGQIRLSAAVESEGADDWLLRFEVEDTGIGIDENAQLQLFESFGQADGSMTRRHGGTGLGLAINRRLAELMGGGVGVESRPGVGSRFWVTVRLGKAEAATAAESASDWLDSATPPTAELPPARLLLAEDNPINQEVAVALLQDLGMRVDVADNGAQAVELARHNGYDLILMDVQMPLLDGLEATRAIRALPAHAATPILAMTANAFAEDRAQCMAAGMNDHLGKPVEPRMLAAMLHKWLPAVTRLAGEAVQPLAAAPVVVARAAAVDALATIAGLDTGLGLRAVRGDVALYTRLLDHFAEHHAEDGRALREHLAQGDADSARRLAHGLKGVAATLGAVELQGLAAALEAALAQGPVTAEVERLVTELDEALAALTAAISAHRAPGQGAMPVPADLAAAVSVLGRLETLLRADDALATRLVREHVELLRATRGAAAQDLARQVEMFDYEGALVTLAAMRAAADATPTTDAEAQDE